MADKPELESLYREAQSALKAREYDRAGGLLKQVLMVDDDYKDASRLLAQAIKLKRRRWYSHPMLWSALGMVVIVGLGIWIATRISFPKAIVPTTTFSPIPAISQTPSKTPTPTPTSIPLAWKRLYIGQEFPRDNINVIVFDPKDPDVIYVGTQNAGVYKSIDGGSSWQPAHQGLGGAWVSSLVIDPQNPQTLYAGIALGGVYKTTDGGSNWYSKNDGINTDGWEWVSIVVVSPEDSQKIYYSQSYNLYTSTNGGETWTEILSGGSENTGCPRLIGSLVVDPTNPATLLAFNLENPGEDIVCQNGVYKSSDGGNSWTLSLQVEPVFGLQRSTLVFDHAGKNLYAVEKNSVYRSTDHGETWQRLDPSDFGVGECIVLAIDPQDGSTAYCASFIKITMTRNGGASWQDLLNKDHTQSIAVSPHSNQTVFVGWNGLWATMDNGKSWFAANNGLGAIHIGLSFDPLEPSALLLEDETCTVYRSTDGGRKWDPAPERTCQSKMALGASGEWLYWIDQDDGSLRRSQDRGATSKRLNWPIEADTDRIIASLPGNGDRLLVIYSFETPYIFVSDDHGETWHGATLIGWDPCCSNPGPGPRLAFDPTSGQRVYLISMTQVFRSDDAGETWQECVNRGNTGSWLGTASRKGGMIVQPGNPDRIFLATRGDGILSSIDGCGSWQTANTGLGNLFVNTLAIDPNDSNMIYAGTDGGAYVSFDFGQTWSQINDGLLGATVVYSIVVDKDGNVCAATPYGIFKLEGK